MSGASYHYNTLADANRVETLSRSVSPDSSHQSSPHVSSQTEAQPAIISSTADQNAQGTIRDVSIHSEEPKDDPSRPPSHGQVRAYQKWYRRRPTWWWWEIACAGLSIVCIALTFVLLLHLNDVSYASWEYRISPNALISILVTTAEASMLVSTAACIGQLKWSHYRRHKPLYHMQIYDDASRGPYGAFTMLFSTIPGLATIGAVLTILSIAISPFSQQILRFPSRPVNHRFNNASMQRANSYYSKWYDTQNDELRTLGSYYPALDPSINIAILNGLHQTNAPLRPLCSTGNCTYPQFASLGFCSQCLDVTKKTEQFCRPYNYSTDNIKYYSQWDETPVDCSYTTPSGIKLSSGHDVLQHDSVNFEVFRPRWTSQAITHNLTHSNLGKKAAEITNPIVGFASARYLEYTRYDLNNASVAEAKPNLTECAIYLCEKSYENNTFSRGEVYVQPAKIQQLFWATSDDPLKLKSGNDTILRNSSYIINWKSLNPLLLALETIFSSTITEKSNAQDRLNQMARLYGSSDLGEAMEHIATSLTDHIRTSKHATNVTGSAWTSETYIHVRWEWMTLPTAVIFFSAIFLAITILVDSFQRGTLWKSSVLALLLHEVKTIPGPNGFDSSMSLEAVKDAAKRVKVTLEQDRGWCLAAGED
jgi:Protein of unknown function (DUF3176)